MGLALLLVLAAVEGPAATAGAARPSSAAAPTFRSVPLSTSRVPATFRLQLADTPSAPTVPSVRPEPKDPPDVTCTMRVVRMGAAVDPGFVVPAPGPPFLRDPIVQDELSPCLAPARRGRSGGR